MRRFILIAALVLGTTAYAHQGVKNPAVQARMHNMMLISDAVKLLGNMAKGAPAFDAGAANASLQVIRDEAAKTVSLFEAKEDDPKSEAKPAIWENFADFTAKADTLQSVSHSIENFATLDDVAAAMPKLGATCASCHKAYRE